MGNRNSKSPFVLISIESKIFFPPEKSNLPQLSSAYLQGRVFRRKGQLGRSMCAVAFKEASFLTTCNSYHPA